MNRRNFNPFRPTRWEHHGSGRPLIWFSSAADDIIGHKPTFIYGSRGSGKTSLLRSICWEDLIENESLKLQKSFRDFQHIGVYIRFPDHVSSSLYYYDWGKFFPASPSPELEYHNLFSLVVEALCLERLLEALHALRLANCVSFDASHEISCCDYFVREFPAVLSFCPDEPKTFLGVARMLRLMTRSINVLVGRGQISELLDQLPHRVAGEMLANFCERLSIGIRQTDVQSPDTLTFKFCLDDCEVLNEVQRKSLVTLVRTSRAPVSWVIASVGRRWESGETFIPSQPLTDADRKNVLLDARGERGFRELCQSVVSLRLLFGAGTAGPISLSTTALNQAFDLDRRLGVQSVNAVLDILLRRSNRPIAHQIKRAAEILANFSPDDASTAVAQEGRERRILPYYEAYTLLHWNEDSQSFRSAFTEGDVQQIGKYRDDLAAPAFNAWLRRKQQSALLQLSQVLRVRVLPLEGHNNIVTLADGSIRDFLEIMGEIFGEYVERRGASPDVISSFVKSQGKIAQKTQTDGIYAASEAYFDGIANRVDVNNDAIGRLVSGLCILTSLLQSRPGDPRVLSSAERGIFVLSLDRPGGKTLEGVALGLHRLLEQAELAGYLRSVPNQKAHMDKITGAGWQNVAFRVHRRFAPHFRFSVRGAYEPVRLSAELLARLCLDYGDVTPEAWAAAAVDGLGEGGGDQMTLPLFSGVSDDEQ